MTEHPIDAWHRHIRERDLAGLGLLLDDEILFYSSLVHTPQRGKRIALAYLKATFDLVVTVAAFRYTRNIIGQSDAAIEFEFDLDGVEVNGVKLLRWNAAGRITEIKLMMRPLRAMEAVQARFEKLLQAGR